MKLLLLALLLPSVAQATDLSICETFASSARDIQQIRQLTSLDTKEGLLRYITKGDLSQASEGSMVYNMSSIVYDNYYITANKYVVYKEVGSWCLQERQTSNE